MHILVTGCSGFLATEIANQFLAAGHKVRGTFRSQQKADAWLASQGISEGFEHVIVENISVEGSLDQATEGVEVVVHTASPFHSNIKDADKDMLIPAYNGTVETLKSAKKSNTVRHVIITSSFAAVLDFAKLPGEGVVYTPNDWNPATREEALQSKIPSFVYCASKKLAEKAAWDFLKDEKPNFYLTTLCPPKISGPANQDIKAMDQLNTSTSDFSKLLDAKEMPVPNVPVWTDVRDVAKLHVLAATKEIARNKRYLCIAGHWNHEAVAEVIKAHFPEQSHRIPSYDRSRASNTKEGHYQTDSSLCEQELEFEWMSFERSIQDTFAKVFELEARFAN